MNTRKFLKLFIYEFYRNFLFKKTVEYDHHAGNSRQIRGVSSPSKTNSEMGKRSGKHNKSYVDRSSDI